MVGVDGRGRLERRPQSPGPAGLRTRARDAAEALDALCAEEEAELLVVGSRGRTGPAAALAGSVYGRLARRGRCPVVIVPPDAADHFLVPPRRGGSVMCGIDGSVASARAVQVARNVAERLGLELVAVHVDTGDRPARGADLRSSTEPV